MGVVDMLSIRIIRIVGIICNIIRRINTLHTTLYHPVMRSQVLLHSLLVLSVRAENTA